jgi:hypothetical protein
MEKRLLKRGETSGRADDNADTIRKRFKTFLEQSLPVKDHYLKLNKCHVISAVPAPEAVFEEVAKALDPILPKVRTPACCLLVGSAPAHALGTLGASNGRWASSLAAQRANRSLVLTPLAAGR